MKVFIIGTGIDISALSRLCDDIEIIDIDHEVIDSELHDNKWQVNPDSLKLEISSLLKEIDILSVNNPLVNTKPKYHNRNTNMPKQSRSKHKPYNCRNKKF